MSKLSEFIAKKSSFELLVMAVPIIGVIVTVATFVMYDRNLKKGQIELVNLQIAELKKKGVTAETA